jgi:hypothetical protein
MSDERPSGLNEDKVAAALSAFAMLLRSLIVYVEKSHPGFSEYLRHQVDVNLGKRLVDTGESSKLDEELRRIFRELVDGHPSFLEGGDVFKERPRKLTLRRRFLNWLQEG